MKFDNNRPIYLQIIDDLVIKIVSGEYLPDAKIPTVRELAAKLKVNPNTLQRAFVELEQLGIIVTQRTNGRFVTDDQEILVNLKNELALKHVKEFYNNMNQLGFSKVQIKEYLENYKEGDNDVS